MKHVVEGTYFCHDSVILKMLFVTCNKCSSSAYVKCEFPEKMCKKSSLFSGVGFHFIS